MSKRMGREKERESERGFYDYAVGITAVLFQGRVEQITSSKAAALTLPEPT